MRRVSTNQLHKEVMTTVRKQIELGEPPFVARAFERAVASLGDEEQALRVIAGAFLAETMRMLKAGEEHIDQAAYQARLEELPLDG